MELKMYVLTQPVFLIAGNSAIPVATAPSASSSPTETISPRPTATTDPLTSPIRSSRWWWMQHRTVRREKSF